MALDNGHRASNKGSPVSSCEISPLLVARILTVVLVVHDSDQKTEVTKQAVIREVEIGVIRILNRSSWEGIALDEVVIDVS